MEYHYKKDDYQAGDIFKPINNQTNDAKYTTNGFHWENYFFFNDNLIFTQSSGISFT